MTTLPWDEMYSNAKDTGKTRVPDGVYECVIKSTETGQTAAPNCYKKISARFVVESGPYKGGSIFNNFIITPDKPGGMDLFFRNMDTLGLTEEYLKATKPELEQLADMLVERRAEVTLATRMYNGKEYDDVKNLKPLGTPGAGFAFGGDTILPTPSPVPVPSGPMTPSAPVPVAAAAAVAVPVPPSDNELPPEPPF